MQIYHYDPLTGAYVGTSEADESPLEPGEFLIPAFATLTSPPQPGVNQVAIYSNGSWTLQNIAIPTLADAQTAKLAILDANAAAAYVAGFQSSASGTALWYDSDEQTQKLLESIYNRTKETDWTTKVRYPNIAPAGKAPIRARPTATDPESAKEIQLLDAAQIKILIDDLGDAIFTVKSHLWEKQAEVQAASDVAAVEAITW